MSIGGRPQKPTNYRVQVELGGLAGVVAPIIGKQPSDVHFWILVGDAPPFSAKSQFMKLGQSSESISFRPPFPAPDNRPYTPQQYRRAQTEGKEMLLHQATCDVNVVPAFSGTPGEKRNGMDIREPAGPYFKHLVRQISARVFMIDRYLSR